MSCSVWNWHIICEVSNTNGGLHQKKTHYSHYALSEVANFMAIKWGLPWGLLCGTSGRRKLCMGFGGGKRWWDALKSSIGVAMQATRGDSFYGEGEFSLCNAVVLKLYLSLNGTVKDFIGYLTSLYYSCVTCFIFIEIGRPKVQFKKVS